MVFAIQPIINESVVFYSALDRSIFGSLAVQDVNELIFLDIRESIVFDDEVKLLSHDEQNELFAVLQLWRKANKVQYGYDESAIHAEIIFWRKPKKSTRMSVPSVYEYHKKYTTMFSHPEHLDFYEAGIFDVEAIVGYKEHGIDTELALRMVAA